MARSTDTITENDRKIMATAWLCMETEPKINFDKLAQAMGWKNSQTARSCFGPVKKKFLANLAIETGTPRALKETPKKGRGKRVAQAGGDGDDEEEVGVKKMKRVRKGIKVEEEEEEEEEEELAQEDEASSPVKAEPGVDGGEGGAARL